MPFNAGEPIRLRTLGALELRGARPGVAEEILAQPKRLALLIYLAARAPGEAVRRDRIVATFWPELPEQRARANLRNSLHFLRNRLGAGALEGTGAHVAVCQTRLVCDAGLLLSLPDSAEADERVRAWGDLGSFSPRRHPILDLHRGEFLDGFNISGSPDFERWVDGLRAQLRARASSVAWALSRRSEAAREWISAAAHARRAVELSVDEEGASQRLIRLLDRAGD